MPAHAHYHPLPAYNLKFSLVNKTAVIILEYNNSADTINCIESVMRHNTSPIKFIVVDNGSTQRQAVADLESYFAGRFAGSWMSLNDGDVADAPLPFVTFLESGSNDGYAKGNNKGLSLADADPEIDSILILNSDILFVQDIIPGLLERLRLPDAAIVSPVLYKKGMAEIDGNCARRSLTVGEVVWMHYPFPYDVFGISKRRRLNIGLDGGPMPIELPSGSCMLLRKDVFRELGWFDPGTFLYFEEDILFEKVKARRRRNYIDTGLKCIHLGATTTKSAPSRFMATCSTSSAAYYIREYRNASALQLGLLKLFASVMMLKIKLKEMLKRE